VEKDLKKMEKGEKSFELKQIIEGGLSN